MSVTAYVPPGNASSPGQTLPKPVINIATQEVTIPTSAYVVKSTRQLRMIVARTDKTIEDYLRQFKHKLVRVYVPDMGVTFTAAINERKNDHHLFVRIPSNLKRFFIPLWQNNAMFLVYITIDTKLLQLDQETQSVRSQVGDGPAPMGSVNRPALVGSGGQTPRDPQEG